MDKTIDALSMLTAKQIAQLNAFNDASLMGKTHMALHISGSAGAAFKAAVDEHIINDLFVQFERAKYSNVAMFARYINTLTGSWLDTGKLPACPSKLDDFLKYQSILWSWTLSTTNEKTSLKRAKIYAVMRPVLDKAYKLIEDARAARSSEAKSSEAKSSKAKSSKAKSSELTA